MRLNELVGVKSVDNLSLYQLIDAWEKESGYKALGKGHFAFVFKHPSKNEVIKLWLHDSSYESFVEYCRSHNNNKCLPKILTPIKSFSTFHRRLYGFPDKIKYVRMELLRELEPKDLKITTFLKLVNLLKTINEKIKELDIDELLPEISHYWKDGKVPKNLIELIKVIEDLPISIDTLDIHDGNIMVRPSTGDLVLTDPAAEDSDVESMDLILHSVPDVDELPPENTITGKNRKRS